MTLGSSGGLGMLGSRPQPQLRGGNATIHRRCRRFKPVKPPVILAVTVAAVAGAGWGGRGAALLRLLSGKAMPRPIS